MRRSVTNVLESKTVVLCMGIKMYNSLPVHIKNGSHNQKKFESVLKSFYIRTHFIH